MIDLKNHKIKVSFANTYNSDPKVFVEELVNDATSKLLDKNATKEEKVIFIEKIAEENVDIDQPLKHDRVDVGSTTTTLLNNTRDPRSL